MDAYSKPRTISEINNTNAVTRENDNRSSAKALLVFIALGVGLTCAFKYGNQLRNERIADKKVKTEAAAKANIAPAMNMK